MAPPVAGLAALGAAGVALSAAAAWIAATGAGPAPRGFSAVVHALVIAAPIAAGLYAVRVNPRGRFGWLLILAGVLWSPTMLAESPDSLLYSIGRVWVWFAELLLIYLVLAFPSGRFASRSDRLLFRAGVVAVAAYLLLALLGDFPTPNPWASCGTDCPPNAFMLPSSEPGFVDAVLLPITQALSVAVFVGVAVRLVGRLAERQQPDASGARAGTGRRCPANGCDRRLPHCARSESGLQSHRGARRGRAPRHARRIGRLPDRAGELACPRRESARQAERRSGSSKR